MPIGTYVSIITLNVNGLNAVLNSNTYMWVLILQKLWTCSQKWKTQHDLFTCLITLRRDKCWFQEGTSAGFIAILYFKRIFTLEPIQVSKSSSHSGLRPSTAPRHLPVAAEAGCSWEEVSRARSACVWSLHETPVSGLLRSPCSIRPSLSTQGQ